MSIKKTKAAELSATDARLKLGFYDSFSSMKKKYIVLEMSLNQTNMITVVSKLSCTTGVDEHAPPIPYSAVV
jgi:hypothetical protein